MKTSNKILLGLLIAIFVIPLLLAYTLKNKIENKEFTTEKMGHEKPVVQHSGSFTAYKVVKVTSPEPELLRCRLKLSDANKYDYTTIGKDSINVYTGNDTLYVQYVSPKEFKEAEKNYRYSLEVTINLPAFNNLIIDGAIVILDSVPAAAQPFSVTLKNNGVLKDGSANGERENVKVPAKKTVDVAQQKTAPANAGRKSLENKTSKPTATQQVTTASLDFDVKYPPIFKFI